MEVLYGLHPVSEALKAGRRRFDHVLVARERHDDRLDRVIAQCRDAGIRVREESREQLTLAANTPAHQGVVALVRPQEFLTIEDLFEPDPATNKSAARLVLAIDGVEDPQNLGALLRVADGAGVDGVLLTERRSAPLSPAAMKASAGAAEHLRIARVVNLVRSLEELKKHNLWIVGLDAGSQDAGVAERGLTAGPTPRGPAAGPTPYDQFDFTGDLVIVLGSEGAGLHELVRRTCDHLLHIPMAGGVSSLNVSAAGAVVLYEAARQRRAAAKSPDTLFQKAAPRSGAGAPRKKQKGLGS
ncbi:MAG: 23S rRNA (guanosine(2251)-2'-O)-methyltransferase RlmB [Terracidiphilus sp.]